MKYTIKVDEDLAVIILAMKKDKLINKAIRNYAKALIGVKNWYRYYTMLKKG